MLKSFQATMDQSSLGVYVKHSSALGKRSHSIFLCTGGVEIPTSRWHIFPMYHDMDGVNSKDPPSMPQL